MEVEKGDLVSCLSLLYTLNKTGILAEVGTKRLAGRSISSGCCFPGTFISHQTAFSVRWLRREFLKSFIQQWALFAGVPFNDRGRQTNHAYKLCQAFVKAFCILQLLYKCFTGCRDKLFMANRCLFLHGSALHTLAPLLLLISLHASLHLLPVLLLTIPASKQSTLTIHWCFNSEGIYVVFNQYRLCTWAYLSWQQLRVIGARSGSSRGNVVVVGYITISKCIHCYKTWNQYKAIHSPSTLCAGEACKCATLMDTN